MEQMTAISTAHDPDSEPADVGPGPAPGAGFAIPPLELAVAAVLAAVAIALLALVVLGSDAEPSGAQDPVLVPASGQRSPASQPTADGQTGDQTGDQPAPDALLPDGSCTTDGAGTVSCADPVPGVDTVVIRTYPSREELYAAYVRDVEALTDRPFVGNVGDCSGRSSEGEVSWSLNRTKSRDYPLRMLRDGGLDPVDEAAGRVFCTVADGVPTFVWTQDAYRIVVAVGPEAEELGRWWVAAHIDLACRDEAAACPA